MPQSAVTRTAVETVQAFYDAVARGDLPALRPLMAPDIVFEMPFATAEQKLWSGAETVMTIFENVTGNFSSVGFEDVVMIPAADPEIVVVECTGKMVTKTGSPYENKYIEYYRVRDSQIAHCKEYFDPIVAARAFGIPLS